MGDEWDNSSTFPAESPAMNSLFSSRYLDPKVDLAFKRIFGEHEHLLRSFLNAMLPLPEGREITQLEYLTPEQVPEIPGLMKYSIVDVKCTDTQGRIFIVEMQMLWIPSFASRIVFAGAQAYVKQLAAGQNYGKLQPVYVLAMINDQFRRDTDEFYHHYTVSDVQAPQETLEGLQFVLVEIPKFKATTFSTKRMQALWLRFLSEIGRGEPDAEMLANTDIAEALALMETANLSPRLLDAYHDDLDKMRIQSSVMEDTLEKGIKQGLEKGKAEMIQALHASGMPVEQIATIAQLPLSEARRILQL
jgi:predicted transposase/invertase (TIGR01784 family)